VLPRPLSGIEALRLTLGALLLAMLLPGAAARAASEGDPFTSVVDGQSYLGNTPLRIWHRTRGYGTETADTAFGTHWATPLESGIAFVDGQFRVGNSDTDFSLDVGAGFRWRADDFFTGNPRIFGFSFWYDGEDTKLNNFFNQLGVSFERLGEAVDLRLNANIPLEDPKAGDNQVFTGETGYVGNILAQGTLVGVDVPLRVVDFEVAPRIFNLNAWVYGGGYQMDGEGISEFGYKAGARGYVTNDLALDVGVSDDQVFGTNTVVQIIWTPGRTTPGISSWSHNIDDRMREQVYRNAYVATQQVVGVGAVALTDASGRDIRVVHVDSNAAAGGDGTFEAPLNNLTEVQSNSQIGDIILVHALSSFDGQSATLQDSQRFLGEGNNVTHNVFTSELGTIVLPETFAGALAAANPLIQNAPGPGAIILAGGNNRVENLAEIEVSNFRVAGGTSGVVSPNGVGDVNINNMSFTNTTSHAIDIKPLVETLTNNTTRVRFTPTIDKVTFAGVGGDDIRINANVGEPTTTPIVETIAISNVTSDDGQGVGINLIDTKRAVAISNIDWDGGATGLGALRIENAGAQSNVTLNGTNTISDGIGFGIALINGAATHTVTGTTITNTGGDSILASGGVGSMNFTGFISQNNDGAAVLRANDGHDGTLTFRELTTGGGVIAATDGNGLQFDNADGVYTFTHAVSLTGTDAGVNVVNGSSAVITLSNATISNPTGVAVNFNGGDANMSYTGRIAQEASNFAVVNVAGGHTGTLTFSEREAGSGVIRATTGTGLVFNNADGAYTFNHEVELDGSATNADTGVDISNGSAGTFAFTLVDIDYNSLNAADSAVRITGSAPQSFSMAGDIDSTGGRPVELTNNTGGSIAFSATIDSTAGGNGILVQGNTGGVNSFTGAVNLSTGAMAGVTINNNTAGSTSFNNLDITTTSGDGFVVTNSTGHSVTVSGTDNTITSTGGIALNMSNSTVGGGGVNFLRVSADGGSNGILLNNVAGGSINVGANALNNGDGGTIQNMTGNAVQLTNVSGFTLNRAIINNNAAGADSIEINQTGTSTSTVTVNNTQINNSVAAGDGVEVNHSGSAVSNVTVVNSQITGGASGIDYNRTASATSRLTLSNITVADTALAGIDINIAGSADANVTINNGTNVSNSNNAQALVFNTSGGSNKIVRVLVDGSTFDSNSGATQTADFQFAGTGTFNANITNNSFNNGGAGRAFEMASNSIASLVRLNLDGNIGTSGNANAFLLEENAGDFDIVDRATVDTRNTGGIEFVPNEAAFDDIPGPVPLPQ